MTSCRCPDNPNLLRNNSRKSSEASESSKSLKTKSESIEDNEEQVQRKEIIPEKSTSKLVWILGGPGTSISSFVDKLREELDIVYLHIDSLIAKEINAKTSKGTEILSCIKEADDIPASLLIPLAKSAIRENYAVAVILIDGFPRSFTEAVDFQQDIYPFSLIIILNCSESEQISRVVQCSPNNEIPIKPALNLAMQIKNIQQNRKFLSEVIAEYPDITCEIEDEEVTENVYYETKCALATNIPECIIQSKENELAALRESKLPVIWVLGGPGSGKGTQCDRIVAKYGFTHLSTGDLLRNEVSSGSERGQELNAIMERGELVPMETVLNLLKEAMLTAAKTSKGFLIDGYPREKSQGIAFESQIVPVDIILYFDCTEETLVKRLLGRAQSSGRADDNEETIKLRLKTFLDNNDKVLSQYPTKLRRIDAERDVEDIFAEVCREIDSISK